MPWTRPVILLAHGAWHEPELYDPLKIALGTRGYGLIVPRLAKMGEGKTGTNWDAHVATLLDAAAPLFDLGRSVVLAAHSYGGTPATIASRNNGFDKRRAAWKTWRDQPACLHLFFCHASQGHRCSQCLWWQLATMAQSH